MAKRWSFNKQEATGAEGQVTEHESRTMAERWSFSKQEAAGAAGRLTENDALSSSFPAHVDPENVDVDFADIQDGSSTNQSGLKLPRPRNNGSEFLSQSDQLPNGTLFNGICHPTQTIVHPISSLFAQHSDSHNREMEASQHKIELSAHRTMVEEAFGLSDHQDRLHNFTAPSESTEFFDAMEMWDRTKEVSEASEELQFTSKTIPYVSVYPPIDDEMMDISKPAVGEAEIREARTVHFTKAKAMRIYLTQEGDMQYVVRG